jgi:hypothetical protein
MKGRPNKTDPRTHQYRIRLNEEEYSDMQFLIMFGYNPSQIFREALKMHVNLIENMDEEDDNEV